MSEAELRERVGFQISYCPQEPAAARVRAWAEDDPTAAARETGDRLWILVAPDVAGLGCRRQTSAAGSTEALIPKARIVETRRERARSPSPGSPPTRSGESARRCAWNRAGERALPARCRLRRGWRRSGRSRCRAACCFPGTGSSSAPGSPRPASIPSASASSRLLITVGAALYLIVRCAAGYELPRPLREGSLLAVAGAWAAVPGRLPDARPARQHLRLYRYPPALRDLRRPWRLARAAARRPAPAPGRDRGASDAAERPKSEAGRSPSVPLRHEEVPREDPIGVPAVDGCAQPPSAAGRPTRAAAKRPIGRLSDARRAGHQAIAKAIGEQPLEGGHRPGVGADQIARSGPPRGQGVDNDLGHLLAAATRARRSAPATSRVRRSIAVELRPSADRLPRTALASPCPSPRSGWRWTRARRSRPGRRTGAAPGATRRRPPRSRTSRRGRGHVRSGDQAADRADEDEPPASSPQRRDEGLGHRDLADQVHLDLAAEVVTGSSSAAPPPRSRRC